MTARGSRRTLALAIALAAAMVGCGGGGGGDGGTPIGMVMQTSGPYQPLSVGTTWAYHVNDQGVVYDKQSSVEAQEDIGGPKAGITGFRVRETIKGAIQLTWYEPTQTEVRRHHDQLMDGNGHLSSDEWYDPYMLRIDLTPEHLQANATWTMSYTDTKTTSTKPTQMVMHTESYHVDAVDMPIGVPAGTFAAIQITRTDMGDGSTKTQWFVKGVGKVKEQTGAGHLEELTSYQVMP
jgi:hypothetical protein